jgi:SAM-dependent methyltransferase
MLPPDFAAFSFHVDADGTDEALVDRTVASMGASLGGGAARVAVCGAGRWSLLLALARRGARVVAFDPSRLALRTARDAAEHAGVADRIEFFAADPRDVVIPGGVDGALVTSFAWRVLLTREAQAQLLECLHRAVAPGGALCLDVDRLPPATTAETEKTLLRRGPGGQTWWWRRDPTRSLVTVSCDAPRVGSVEVALSDATPESSAALLAAAGFDVEGDAAAGATRAFLVGRTPAA